MRREDDRYARRDDDAYARRRDLEDDERYRRREREAEPWGAGAREDDRWASERDEWARREAQRREDLAMRREWAPEYGESREARAWRPEYADPRGARNVEREWNASRGWSATRRPRSREWDAGRRPIEESGTLSGGWTDSAARERYGWDDDGSEPHMGYGSSGMMARGPAGGIAYGPSGEIGFGATDTFDRGYGREAGSYRAPLNTGRSFLGRGPRGYRRSDERILEDVNDRLTDHPAIDASDVVVDVRECEVVLTGMVDSREQRRLAEDVAECVSGVRDVSNHIKVRRDRDLPRERDREVRAEGWEPARGSRSMTDPATTPVAGGTGTALTSASLRSQIRPGMIVVTSDHEELGHVKEIRGMDFLLDRPMKRDVYVPLDQVRDVRNDRAVLQVNKDQIDAMRWESPPILAGGSDRER